jgi:hypothetical protein
MLINKQKADSAILSACELNGKSCVPEIVTQAEFQAVTHLG